MANHAHSTPVPDRRHLLGAALAIGALAASPAAAASPDAALLEIERRLDEIQPELQRRRAVQSGRIEAAWDAWVEAGRPGSTRALPMEGLIAFEEAQGVYDADCDFDDLGWQVTYLTRRAAELPAQSLDGIRLKTMLAVAAYLPSEDDEEVGDLLLDLVRLTGAADGRPWFAQEAAGLTR
jgi:hypothetical protein